MKARQQCMVVVLVVFCAFHFREEASSLSNFWKEQWIEASSNRTAKSATVAAKNVTTTATKPEGLTNVLSRNGTKASPPSHESTITATPSSISSSYPERIKHFFSTPLTNRFTLSPEESKSIDWLQDYLIWHDQMRQQFPGYSIFTDPKAPKTAVHYALDHRYGLNDRLANIADTLLLCHQEQRVLFYKWFEAPMDLEAFLMPHLFNWSLPSHEYTSDAERFVNFTIALTPQEQKTLKSKSNKNAAQALLKDRKMRPIANVDHTVVRGAYTKPFDVFWKVTFQPSDRVQKIIDETMTKFGLIPKQYDAIHMRVRHPAFFGNSTFDKNVSVNVVDAAPTKVLTAAATSLQCAQWLAQNQTNTTNTENSTTTNAIYFYSDSSHLVGIMVDPKTYYIVRNLDISNEQKLAAKRALGALRETKQSLYSLENTSIVGRTNTTSAHIAATAAETGMMKDNREMFESFASTFVDLYLAANARCITLGVGRFAVFAAKIGGISCVTESVALPRYIIRRWGMEFAFRDIPTCPFATER